MIVSHIIDSVPCIYIFLRGGSAWKPTVTPTGTLSKPQPTVNSVAPVTKTSLAASKQDNSSAIGTGHNVSAKPFASQPQVNKTLSFITKMKNKKFLDSSTVQLTEVPNLSTSSTILLWVYILNRQLPKHYQLKLKFFHLEF